MFLELNSSSEKQTIAYAKEFASKLVLPAVLSLEGDLGSGKTTFTKGLALGIGIEEIITSPTFTILNEFDGKNKLFHFDMYRLSSLEEALELGFDEYFSAKTMKGLVVCEWACNIVGLLPQNAIHIKIDKISDTKRKITISDLGEK